MKLINILFVVVVIGFSIRTLATPITAVTEHLPPYNYLENGQIKGISPDLAREALRRIGLTATFDLYPWARSYDKALKNSHVLIFSIARTPERESKFHWLGSISGYSICLYTLANQTEHQLKNIQEAKGKALGVMRQSNGQYILRRMGFQQNDDYMLYANNEAMYQALKRQQVDYIVSTPRFIEFAMAQGQPDKQTYIKQSLCLNENQQLFIAFSINTPHTLVNRFKQTLLTMEKDGTKEEILAKYRSTTY